jgi:hypothetical protein
MRRDVSQQYRLDSAPQHGLPRSGVCQSDIFECLDSPGALPSRDYGQDESIDVVRAVRVGRTGAEAAPEMDDHSAVRDRRGIDQLVLERGISIDRLMDRLVEGDNLINPAYVVAEAVYEGRVLVEKSGKGRHVVRIPSGLKRRRHILGPLNRRHGFLARRRLPSLESPDGRQPGGRPLFVKARLHLRRRDLRDTPSIVGRERRSQFVLADRMRTAIGALVAEAQHIERSAMLGHRRQARRIGRSLRGVEGVKQAAIQHRLKPATQSFQVEGIGRNERDVDAAGACFLASDRQRGFGDIEAQYAHAERGNVERIFPGAAAGVEHWARESDLCYQADEGGLRFANIPGRRAVVV